MSARIWCHNLARGYPYRRAVAYAMLLTVVKTIIDNCQLPHTTTHSTHADDVSATGLWSEPAQSRLSRAQHILSQLSGHVITEWEWRATHVIGCVSLWLCSSLNYLRRTARVTTRKATLNPFAWHSVKPSTFTRSVAVEVYQCQVSDPSCSEARRQESNVGLNVMS